MRRAALLAAVVLAGCGDDEKAGPPEAAGAQGVAERYLDAVGAKDWSAACETRVAAERQMSGLSCEDTLKSLLGAGDTSAYAEAEITDVRVVGERAGIDFIVPGQDFTQRLAAVVEDGEWRLEDVPDSEIP